MCFGRLGYGFFSVKGCPSILTMGLPMTLSYLVSRFVWVFYHLYGCGSVALRVDGDVAVVELFVRLLIGQLLSLRSLRGRGRMI